MKEGTMRKRVEGLIEEQTGKARAAMGRILREEAMEREGVRMEAEGRDKMERAEAEERASQERAWRDRAQELSGEPPQEDGAEPSGVRARSNR